MGFSPKHFKGQATTEDHSSQSILDWDYFNGKSKTGEGYSRVTEALINFDYEPYDMTSKTDIHIVRLRTYYNAFKDITEDNGLIGCTSEYLGEKVSFTNREDAHYTNYLELHIAEYCNMTYRQYLDQTPIEILNMVRRVKLLIDSINNIGPGGEK